MGRYRLTKKAVSDLTKIWNYTINKWSENQAEKYYQHLIQTFEEIAANPALGKSYHGVAPHLLGLKTQRHIIFYKKICIDEVEINRILHEMMDLKKRI